MAFLRFMETLKRRKLLFCAFPRPFDDAIKRGKALVSVLRRPYQMVLAVPNGMAASLVKLHPRMLPHPVA